jgi:RNA polymerase sigma factor (sigma-70 family)
MPRARFPSGNRASAERRTKVKLDTRATDLDVTRPEVDTHASSFELFYRSERDGLFADLSLMTRDPHEAEELMHDAFLKVWERWGRVRYMDRPAGYLHRTALNAFRTRYRRAAIAKRMRGWTSKGDPLEDVEGRDRVDRALAALTVRQRMAVILTDLLDYTSVEAGRVPGVQPGTVRVLAHRGHDALRKAM